jgi:regulator of sigma D
MRLQAYERLILFLERISPDALLLKLKNQALTNSDLHLAILQQIRMEYEHNISQQLYVSDAIWSRIKETKEQIALFINDIAKQSNPNSASIDLAKQILDKLMEEENSLISETIKAIKAEARKIM